MAEPEKKKLSFWEVFLSYMTPGVVNATAAVAVALVGLVTAIVTKSAIKAWKKDSDKKDGSV
jgi:hypothetical protein